MTAWERGHRVPPVAEIALATATGAGTFALAAVALDGISSGVVVALLGVVYIVAVIAIARFAGIAYAVPVGMAGMLAYDWFYLPPTHPLEFPDVANLVDLIVYLGVAVLLGELATHAARRAERAERARREIADEQAALRRVATLVARGAPANEVFDAVAAEAGRLLDVHGIRIARYEDETELVHVAEWSKRRIRPSRLRSRQARGDERVCRRASHGPRRPHRQLRGHRGERGVRSWPQCEVGGGRSGRRRRPPMGRDDRLVTERAAPEPTWKVG